jgi:phosphatidylinositol kinase/protein kinase (PI-3  family)
MSCVAVLFLCVVFDDFCSNTFKVAQQNFVGSMAAYSMICFILQVVGFLSVVFISAAVALQLLPFLLLLLDLTNFLSLQIKDRHDGNILIKRDGRCVSFYVLFDILAFQMVGEAV